jgi:hypothetical protein
LKLGCPATTGGVSFFGQDDVVTGQCSVPARFLVAEPKPGPDDARVVTCTTTLTMELAANLGAKPRSGLSIGLLAPGAGTLTVSGTTTGTARAAARRSRPAIRTTRVKARAAGPLKFKLKPTSAAMKTLRRGRPLKLRLRLVFVAADGTRTIKTQALTVKLPVRLPRRPPPPRRP